jgi:hypothetical protein
VEKQLSDESGKKPDIGEARDAMDEMDWCRLITSDVPRSYSTGTVSGERPPKNADK